MFLLSVKHFQPLHKESANGLAQLTGGVGRSSLTTFYRDSFIFNNSADTDLELVSRTIGIDRVIDEFIFKFTHDRELDWL
jgi:carboxymethylenebutenolidase